MQLVHEFRDDTKIASPSSDPPEEVRILRGACGPDQTIGSNYRNLHKIVDDQTMRATITNTLAHPKYESFAEDKKNLNQPKPPPSVSLNQILVPPSPSDN
jgi:hypothetical protein